MPPLEVAVLGRSVGESIVVRYGERRWAIVDSFLADGTWRPLRLLKHFGVAADEVALVVATHWDNDHVGGLAAVLQSAEEARFFYPNVHDRRHLLRLVATAEVAAADGWPRGVEEFGAVLDVLRSTGRTAKAVGSGTTLWRDESTQVLALSPTDAAVHAGLTAIGSELLATPDRATSAVALRPNLTSIALWVETDTHRALLGADLEAHPDFGWSVAIDETANLRLEDKALLLKVPHHGSPDADEPRVWTELLDPNPDAVLTPYGPSRRPREEDIQRLAAQAATVRVVAGSGWRGRNSEALLRAAIPTAGFDARTSVGFAHYVAEGEGWGTSRRGHASVAATESRCRETLPMSRAPTIERQCRTFRTPCKCVSGLVVVVDERPTVGSWRRHTIVPSGLKAVSRTERRWEGRRRDERRIARITDSGQGLLALLFTAASGRRAQRRWMFDVSAA